MRHTSLALLVFFEQFNLLPSFSGHNTLYRLLEASRELTVLHFLLPTLAASLLPLLYSFPNNFGPYGQIFHSDSTFYPLPPPINIHCIWVSPWTQLISSSIKHISSSSSISSCLRNSCPPGYLPLFSSIRSPSKAFPWLRISPWVCRIPPQHSFFCPTLPLISIQSDCPFLPLSYGGRGLFCLCQLPSYCSVQLSLEFFNEGSPLVAAPLGNLFEFLDVLVARPSSLLYCPQLLDLSFFL